MNKPEDALARLVRCISALKKKAVAHSRTWHLLSDVQPQECLDAQAASLSCGPYTVAFAGMTLDQGTLVLARALMAAGRDAKLALILRANGITPMLRST